MLWPACSCWQAARAYNDPSKRTIGEITDDTAIRTGVKTRLIRDPDLPGRKIRVRVRQGAVTLSGRIPSDPLKVKAGRLAAEVKGVKSVDNQLTLIEVD